MSCILVLCPLVFHLLVLISLFPLLLLLGLLPRGLSFQAGRLLLVGNVLYEDIKTCFEHHGVTLTFQWYTLFLESKLKNLENTKSIEADSGHPLPTQSLGCPWFSEITGQAQMRPCLRIDMYQSAENTPKAKRGDRISTTNKGGKQRDGL